MNLLHGNTGWPPHTEHLARCLHINTQYSKTQYMTVIGIIINLKKKNCAERIQLKVIQQPNASWLLASDWSACINSFECSQPSCEICNINNPILNRWGTWGIEVKALAQDRTAVRWWRRDESRAPDSGSRADISIALVQLTLWEKWTLWFLFFSEAFYQGPWWLKALTTMLIESSRPQWSNSLCAYSILKAENYSILIFTHVVSSFPSIRHLPPDFWDCKFYPPFRGHTWHLLYKSWLFGPQCCPSSADLHTLVIKVTPALREP